MISLKSVIPEFVNFVENLAHDYEAGILKSYKYIAKKVKNTINSEVLEKIDSKIPGWIEMSQFREGETLIHVICVFIALLNCDFYKNSSLDQKELLKWIVLFHDIGKKIKERTRDYLHPFNSAVITAKILPQLGFTITNEYPVTIGNWSSFLNTASVKKKNKLIQDNRKLPKIIKQIEIMWGENTAASLIIKAILFHISLEGIKDWPSPSPLTDNEIKLYIDVPLLKLLGILMIVDSAAWNLFNPDLKEKYEKEILSELERAEELISGKNIIFTENREILHEFNW